VMISALLLLYAPEDWHTMAVLAHALAGGLLMMVGVVHVLLVNSRKKEKICG